MQLHLDTDRSRKGSRDQDCPGRTAMREGGDRRWGWGYISLVNMLSLSVMQAGVTCTRFSKHAHTYVQTTEENEIAKERDRWSGKGSRGQGDCPGRISRRKQVFRIKKLVGHQ